MTNGRRMCDTPETPCSGPLVSIVTIFLDPGTFLAEAVASVLAQTYRHWELLLVDDGSCDGSTEAARSWAEAHPDRIRYLEHPGHANRGMSASRNRGWRAAAGDLIAFLDADDVWVPDKLAEQVALLQHQPAAGMLLGATRYWYGWSGRPRDAARDRVVAVGQRSDPAEGRTLTGNALYSPPELLLRLYPLGDGAAPSMSGLMVRRTLLDAVGGFEERFQGFYEDQAFLAKAYATSPVYIADRVWDLYRQHAWSCSADVDPLRYALHRARYLGWLSRRLAGTVRRDPHLAFALDRARRALPELLLSGAKARIAARLRRPGSVGHTATAAMPRGE